MSYVASRNAWFCIRRKLVDLPGGKRVDVPDPSGHPPLAGELVAQARAEEVELTLPPDELDDDGRVRRAA